MAMSALGRRIFDPQGECVLPEPHERTQAVLLPSGQVERRPIGAAEGRSTLALDRVVPRPPKGFHRHHTCGNPACLNADHVVVVSAAFHRKLHAPERYDSHSVRERLDR